MVGVGILTTVQIRYPPSVSNDPYKINIRPDAPSLDLKHSPMLLFSR